MPSKTLTHVDSDGNPRMVDISKKVASQRSARAQAQVEFPQAVATELAANGYLGGKDGQKGSILHTAMIAGVQAAKRTHELIPFCHAIALERCEVSIKPKGRTLHIECLCSTFGKTGVEMEALTGAFAAALCVYDMCKALSAEIVIGNVRLLQKTGGKTDFQLNKKS